MHKVDLHIGKDLQLIGRPENKFGQFVKVPLLDQLAVRIPGKGTEQFHSKERGWNLTREKLSVMGGGYMRKFGFNPWGRASSSRTMRLCVADDHITLVDQVAFGVKDLDQIRSGCNVADKNGNVMVTHTSARVTHVLLEKIETVVGLLNLGFDLSTAVVLSITVQNTNGIVERAED
jgi:hypothetical protein